MRVLHLSTGNGNVACAEPGGLMVVRWADSNCPKCLKSDPDPCRVELDGRGFMEHAVNCPDCGGPMNLKLSRAGSPFYACPRFPECRGTYPSRDDGTPRARRGGPGPRDSAATIHDINDRPPPKYNLPAPRKPIPSASAETARKRNSLNIIFHEFCLEQGVEMKDGILLLRNTTGKRFISEMSEAECDAAGDSIIDFTGSLREWLSQNT